MEETKFSAPKIVLAMINQTRLNIFILHQKDLLIFHREPFDPPTSQCEFTYSRHHRLMEATSMTQWIIQQSFKIMRLKLIQHILATPITNAQKSD